MPEWLAAAAGTTSNKVSRGGEFTEESTLEGLHPPMMRKTGPLLGQVLCESLQELEPIHFEVRVQFGRYKSPKGA